jgi:fibronectin type 3 domain-containing protein
MILAFTGGVEGKGPPAGGVPSAPTGLAAFLVYPHYVRLSWNANPEPGIAGYNVYRNLSPKGSFSKLTPSPVGETSYLDLTPSVGATYYYKVSAVNASGTEGKQSAPVAITVSEVPDTFPPGSPSGFNAQGGYGQVTLSWTNPSDNDFSGTIVRFGLSAYPSGPQDGNLVCDRFAAPASADAFVHSGLSNGRTYYYAAFSYDGAGNYSARTTALATPVDNVPPAISEVREENITSEGASIRWSTDEASDSMIEYGLTTGYGSATPLDAAMVTDHAVTLGGLSPASLYHYRVISADASGNRAVSADRTFSTAPQPGLACRDCHGPMNQYDYFESAGHGKTGISLTCETCHTPGHGHSGAFKELKTVNGFSYPDLATDLQATTDARKSYCLSACHAPLPGNEHPNGYDYLVRYDRWTFIEILSPEGYVLKFGGYPGTTLPASPEVKLLDVDRNGSNSYGDIVMCTTCHEVHGTVTGYRMTPIITGPDNVVQLCFQCHPG